MNPLPLQDKINSMETLKSFIATHSRVAREYEFTFDMGRSKDEEVNHLDQLTAALDLFTSLQRASLDLSRTASAPYANSFDIEVMESFLPAMQHAMKGLLPLIAVYEGDGFLEEAHRQRLKTIEAEVAKCMAL